MGVGKLFYNREGDLIEVVIRGPDGQRIEKRRCKLNDEVECSRLARWLTEKYGFNATVKDIKGNKKDWLDTDSDFLDI